MPAPIASRVALVLTLTQVSTKRGQGPQRFRAAVTLQLLGTRDGSLQRVGDSVLQRHVQVCGVATGSE